MIMGDKPAYPVYNTEADEGWLPPPFDPLGLPAPLTARRTVRPLPLG